MSSLSKVSDFGKKGQRRRIWVRLRALAEFFPTAARVGRKGGSFVPFPGAPIASMYSTQETYKLPHRLIEKKRRDRINECIAQLKDLLPEHLKLTVSEKLAALQRSSSAQRAGGGHSPPAGVPGNCRLDGLIKAPGSPGLEGTHPQTQDFQAEAEPEPCGASLSWLQH